MVADPRRQPNHKYNYVHVAEPVTGAQCHKLIKLKLTKLSKLNMHRKFWLARILAIARARLSHV